MARRTKTLVELEGTQDMRAAFARLDFAALRNAKVVIRESAEEIEREAKARAPVRASVPDYPISEKKAGDAPGSNVRDRIKTLLREHGMVASIGTRFYIARFVEQGTKKMPARPFLNPAFQLVRPKYITRLAGAIDRAGREASRA